jgi:serine/threonine-protein kinase HipA
MRQAEVYRNGILVGILTEHSRTAYQFAYTDSYFANALMPPVSLTLPKQQQVYSSTILFPFFYNMLSEGINKKVQCRQLQIDEDDSFGLLLATTQIDTIGAVTLKPIAS